MAAQDRKKKKPAICRLFMAPPTIGTGDISLAFVQVLLFVGREYLDVSIGSIFGNKITLLDDDPDEKDSLGSFLRRMANVV